MAKKTTTKHATRPPRPFPPPRFLIQFHLAGGGMAEVEDHAGSRDAMTAKVEAALNAPGPWMKLRTRTDTLQLRRKEVLGFQLSKTPPLTEQMLWEEMQEHLPEESDE